MPGVGYRLGYARVSTDAQDAALQQDALVDAGCDRIFVDKLSGALERRPELDHAMDQLRPGDTLVVWRLDRLSRSLKHLIALITALDARGVGFLSLKENIDTTTPTGRLVFHVFGALAEFERDLARERTKAGLDAARARGRVGGRPRALSPDQAATARQLYDRREMTMTQIAEVLGVSRATVYRALDRVPGQPARSTRTDRVPSG